MKRIAIIVAIALAVILAVLLYLPRLVSINYFRPQIEAQLQARFQRPVTFGEIRLTVFPLSFQVHRVSIAEDPNFNTGRPFIGVEELDVRPAFWPLLRGQVQIDRLVLKRPAIELEKNRQGRWNFVSLGRTGAAPAAPATLAIGRLDIVDGQAAVTDQQAGRPRRVYDHFDIRMKDFTPDHPFSIDGSFHLPGAGRELLTFKATAGPLSGAELPATPLQAAFTFDEMSLSGIRKLLDIDALAGTDAEISGQVTAVNRSGVMTMEGALKAGNVVVKGNPLQDSVRAEFALRYDGARKVLNIDRCNLALSQIPVAVTGGMNFLSEPAHLDLKVAANGISLGSLLALGTAGGAALPAGVSGSGKLDLAVQAAGPAGDAAALAIHGTARLENATLILPALAKPVQIHRLDLTFNRQNVTLSKIDISIGQTVTTGTLTLQNFDTPTVRFDLAMNRIVTREWQELLATHGRDRSPAGAADEHRPSLLARLRGNGNIAVGALIYDALTLTDVRSGVTLDRGLIRLQPLSSGICGGVQTGTITIDTRSAPAAITVATALRKVDADRLLTSLSPAKGVLFGILAADASTRFLTGGSTDLTRSLNGKFNLTLTEGKLKGVDLFHELGAIGRFLGAGNSPRRDFTSLTRLAGSFDIANGIARTQDLQALFGEGSLRAAGLVDLANQTMDMRILAVLTKAYSEKVGGSHMPGFMSTALANRNGELIIPVIAGGNLRNPKFSPDMARFAELRLQRYLPAGLGSQQATGGALNPGDGMESKFGVGLWDLLGPWNRPGTKESGVQPARKKEMDAPPPTRPPK